MKQVTTFLLLFFSLTIFAQSPWTKKKNEGYVQLSFSLIPTYNTVFGNPDYDTQREISDNTLQLYGEFGLNDKTTLFANVPFKMLKSGKFTDDMSLVLPLVLTSEESKNTLGNIQFGVKHNFYNKNWVLSGQISVEANTGSFDQSSGLRTGYDAWTFTPLFLAGKSFGKSYLQSFVGFDVRTNGYSSNFKIGGEYGGKIGKDLWLIGFLDIVKSFENGDVILPTSNTYTATYVNDQEYGAFGAKFIYEFSDKYGVNVGFGGAFFGNNVAKAPALSFGLYHKF